MPIRATTTLIHATIMTLLVGLLVTLLLVQAAQSASTQPVPWHPCARIAAACAIIAGTPQRKQATKALPQVDPQVVAACNERNPNFGKGGPARTGT